MLPTVIYWDTYTVDVHKDQRQKKCELIIELIFILNDRKLYCNLRGFCNRNESILQFYMIQVRALLADYLLPDIDMGNFEYCTLADYLGRTDKFPVVRPCIDCMYYSAWVDAVKAPIKLCSVFKCYVQC